MCACDPGYLGDGVTCERQGDVCSQAFTIPSLPYSTTGDTADNFANDYASPASGCGSLTAERGAGSSDSVYSFTATADAEITINVTGTNGFDPALYVVTDCADIANTCIDGGLGEYVSDGTEQATLSVVSGETYFIIVDGNFNSSNEEGTYTLDVYESVCSASNPCDANATCSDVMMMAECTCNPGFEGDGFTCNATAGDTCGDAIALDASALPIAVSSSTTPTLDDYSIDPATCTARTSTLAAGGASSDRVFSFTAPETATYQVSVSNESFDAVVYVVTDCADIGGTCLAHGDDPETQSFAATQNTTYFIIVDGYSSSTNQNGTFDLNVVKL